MRPTAKRHLHVIASVAVTAGVAALSASVPLAMGVTAEAPPAPYVVAIDPGHGGTPDDNHPEKPFDPGVTGVNGLLEKDLTLDLSRRLRTLLEGERVTVIMTRNSDKFVGLATRLEAANQGRANLLISVHFNYFADPAVGGSLVLYPNQQSQAFANTMAAALETQLKPLAIPSNGVMLKSDLWTHAPMPTITLEAAYLTNAREADLLKKARTLDTMAAAIDTGIRAQVPGIAQRQAEITAYEKAHGVKPSPVPVPNPKHLPVVPLGLALGLLLSGIIFRRQLVPALVPALAALLTATRYAIQQIDRDQPDWRNRRGVRRRRSRARPWGARIDLRA